MDWSELLTGQLHNFDTSITTRGFTGHEMLDRVGLIHMNGRIYNPALGRFLQADPFVQEPGYSQSYNRYAYVWNNPLNATDPSGYFRLREWVGAIVAVVGTVMCGPNCGQLGYALIGAASGAASAAANGGNIVQGAFWGAVSSAAFYGVGGAEYSSFGTNAGVVRFAAFGTVGGITSVLQGGKFGHGFASAGIGGSVGGALGLTNGGGWANAGKAAARIVIAGTLSEATGGKFANGAATAAFMVMIQSGMAGAARPTDGGAGEQTSAPVASPEQQHQSGMAKALSVAGDIVGKFGICRIP